MFVDVYKSKSLKEAYAMMFTSPSQLEKVKHKFNAISTDNQKQLL
jgi:hypothetical protein